MRQKVTLSFLTTEQVFLVRKQPFSLRLTALLSYPDSNPHKYAKANVFLNIVALHCCRKEYNTLINDILFIIIFQNTIQ